MFEYLVGGFFILLSVYFRQLYSCFSVFFLSALCNVLIGSWFLFSSLFLVLFCSSNKIDYKVIICSSKISEATKSTAFVVIFLLRYFKNLLFSFNFSLIRAFCSVISSFKSFYYLVFCYPILWLSCVNICHSDNDLYPIEDYIGFKSICIVIILVAKLCILVKRNA